MDFFKWLDINVGGSVAGWRVNCGLRVSLGLIMSRVVYRNGLVQVVFVLIHVKMGRVRVEFFQLVCVTGRVSVGIFFTTLNPNPTLTRPVDTIYHP